MKLKFFFTIFFILISTFSNAQESIHPSMDEAKKLFTSKKYDAAYEWLKQYLSKSPTNPDAYNRIGITLVELKRYEEAQTAFLHAINLDHNHKKAHYNYGRFLALHANRYMEAKEHLLEAINLDSNYSKAHYEMSRVLSKIYEDHHQAAVHAKQAVLLSPQNYKYRIHYAKLLGRKIFKFDEAEIQFKKASELKPNHAKWHVAYAEYLTWGQGDHKRAEYHFRKALELEPDKAYPYYELGEFLTRKIRGQEAQYEAKKHFMKAFELEPENFQVNKFIAYFYTYIGPYTAEAKKYYERAVAINPESAEIHYRLARMLKPDSISALTQFDLLEKALDIQPDHIGSIELSAIRTHYFQGKTRNKTVLKSIELSAINPTQSKDKSIMDKALYSIKRLIKLHPDNAKAHRLYAEYMLNYFYDKHEAKKHYEKAYELTPQSGKVLSGYADLMWRYFFDKQQAEALYKKALNFEPDNYRLELAYIDYLLNGANLNAQALERLEKLVEKLPRIAKINYLLGLTKELLEEYESAFIYYEKAYRLEEDNPVYKKAFNRIANKLDKKTI